MSLYEAGAVLLLILGGITGITAFLMSLDEYVKNYAHDIRKP